jgi:hypothetical protein
MNHGCGYSTTTQLNGTFPRVYNSVTVHTCMLLQVIEKYTAPNDSKTVFEMIYVTVI